MVKLINNYESDIYKSNFLMAVIRNKDNYISNDRFGIKLSERVTIVVRKEIFKMIEAAIGVELSRLIFSNSKRHVTVKGKENENDNDKAVNTVSQQATKRTAKAALPSESSTAWSTPPISESSSGPPPHWE